MRLSYGQVVQEKQATLHLHNGVTAAQEVVTGLSNGETCLSVRRAFELFEVLEGSKVQFAGDSRGQVCLGCRLCGILRSHRVLASVLCGRAAGRTADERTAAGHVFPLLARPLRFCPAILFFPSPSLSASISVRVARDFKATMIVSYTGTRTDDGIEMASLFLGP